MKESWIPKSKRAYFFMILTSIGMVMWVCEELKVAWIGFVLHDTFSVNKIRKPFNKIFQIGK